MNAPSASPDHGREERGQLSPGHISPASPACPACRRCGLSADRGKRGLCHLCYAVPWVACEYREPHEIDPAHESRVLALIGRRAKGLPLFDAPRPHERLAALVGDRDGRDVAAPPPRRGAGLRRAGDPAGGGRRRGAALGEPS